MSNIIELIPVSMYSFCSVEIRYTQRSYPDKKEQAECFIRSQISSIKVDNNLCPRKDT